VMVVRELWFTLVPMFAALRKSASGPSRRIHSLAHVRSWREQSWRGLRGRRFLTQSGCGAGKSGALQQRVVDLRNGRFGDARINPP
jgi:hypothetical protein